MRKCQKGDFYQDHRKALVGWSKYTTLRFSLNIYCLLLVSKHGKTHMPLGLNNGALKNVADQDSKQQNV